MSYPPHGGVVKTGRFTRVGLTWLAVVGTIGAHLALWFLLESRTLQVPGRHLTTQTDLVELHDLLVPRSEHSPSGLSSASVHADRALAIAAANLHGLSGHRDSEEGAFWLRKHLSVRFGDPQMLRALTELGATYAEPTRGEPNYRKASQIWQFAAAWGDRLAMCLLAKLHSGAFGGASKPMVAERWRARAAPAGGCEEAALPGASR
ncbi:MAG: hypothetical protein R3D44_16425 [Hyphomicrobiaceae bacterium]